VKTADVLAVSGVTYRQLDYWARAGYLRPVNERSGSGVHRDWPDLEVAITVLMSRLIEAGMTVPAASVIARDAVGAMWAGTEDVMSVLAPGVVLIITEEASQRRIIDTAPL
jgi:hypothetical protein